MLLSWLSKTLASLLAAVLCSAVFAAVLSQTLLSSHYLETQLMDIHAYNRLSVAISTELAKDAESDVPQLAAAIQQIVTPAVLQQKITTTLDQLQAYYTGNGQPPAIDIRDLVTQAQAMGVPVPADSGLDKPIVLAHSTQAQGLGRRFADVRLGTILLAALLAAALVAVSWKRHKFAALPDVAIVVGVLLGITALLLHFAPSLADQYIKFDFNANAFAGVGHDLAKHIILDLGTRFGVIAAVFFAVGIIARILVGWLARPRAAAPLQPVATPKPQGIV